MGSDWNLSPRRSIIARDASGIFRKVFAWEEVWLTRDSGPEGLFGALFFRLGCTVGHLS